MPHSIYSLLLLVLFSNQAIIPSGHHFLINSIPFIFLVFTYQSDWSLSFFDSLLSITIKFSAFDIESSSCQFVLFPHLLIFLFHSSRLSQSVISVHFHFICSFMFLLFFSANLQSLSQLIVVSKLVPSLPGNTRRFNIKKAAFESSCKIN